MKLTTALLQKLATFHMWNVKQKDDGIDQNTLHCSYGEYVTTNEQTCCPDFASLPCPLKRLVKIYYLLLDFLKACQSVLIRKVKF